MKNRAASSAWIEVCSRCPTISTSRCSRLLGRSKEASKLRLLLDTHVFLWLKSEPERIAAPALTALEDADNELYLSVVSGWEIAIEYALGKLRLPANPPVYVPARIERAGFHELDVTMTHALAVSGLPAHHDDPFDRLLIAQAQIEGMTLVTADPRFAQYSVKSLDARRGL